jgi:hypothetical protein
VADVPSDYPVYLERPEVGVPAWCGHGRRPTTPRVLNDVTSVPVKDALDSTVPWQLVPVRWGERGRVEVMCRARRVWTVTDDWQVREEWLVAHRQPGGKEQYSLSNASAETPLATLVQWRGQRYFVERTFQDGKSELGWDELVAQKYRAWEHHAALNALALWFVMSVRREWARQYPRSEELKAELGLSKLPALSVANIRELLRAVMPLRRLTRVEARRLVKRHLVGRARSTRSRCRSQEQARLAAEGPPSPARDLTPRPS